MTRLASILVVVAVLLVGCGRHAAYVAGDVTLAGKPLTSGVVTFTPIVAGPSAYGNVGEDGRYFLQTGGGKGLDPGNYKVTVAANATAAEAARMGIKVGREGILPLLTPLKYADVTTTPLTVTVAPGRQEIDLEVEPDAPATSPR